MRFSEVLKKLRTESGMTRKQLGEVSGLAEVTIKQYEYGKREPSFKAIQALSQVFGVDLTDLKNYVDAPAADRQRFEIVEPVPDQREKELIDNYHQLNDEGQEYLVTQSRFLLTEERYKKEDRASS